MRKIHLREATIDDKKTLEYWDTKPHVIESGDDADWDWDIELRRDPEWREQLMAELGGAPIGIIQIIDPEKEETHYWGEVGPNKRALDIWIGEEANLGKGYGTDMISQVIDRCFEHPEVDEILIDPLESNTDAIRFYKRIGFEFVEKRTFEDSDCEVYRMSREQWSKHSPE